jgi:phage recombination protein Bet
MSTTKEIALPAPQSLLAWMAQKYSVEPTRMMATLKATCFKGPVSDEQLVALLIVAKEYGLNPFTREIYAFPDKNGGIVPVVGVDGWIRIINENPHFKGMRFTDGPYNADDIPQWIECTIAMDNRNIDLTVREWFNECYKDTPAWNSTGRRMLRHRAMIQCGRIAFGYAGIYEPDEAERFANATEVRTTVTGGGGPGKPPTTPPRAKAAIQLAPTLSLDQLSQLHDKIHAEGTGDHMRGYLQRNGWGSLEEIPASMFTDAVNYLETA